MTKISYIYSSARYTEYTSYTPLHRICLFRSIFLVFVQSQQ